MAKVGHQLAGKGARVVAAGVQLKKSKWNCAQEGEKIDTSNFESDGTPQGMNGFIGLKWDFGGLFDAASNDFDSPPGIFPQDTFPDLYLYLSVAGAQFWNMPQALILSARNGVEARQGVTFDASGESNGLYTLPTGSF
jgi:hypothetical protein